MAGGHGKCVEIIHVIGDTLCQLGKPPVRPDLGPPNIDTDNDKLENINEISEPSNDNNEESLVEIMDDLEINNDRVSEIESPCEEENKIEESDEIKNLSSGQEEATVDPLKEMDSLLEYCFLKACKTSVKSNDLPMLTSNFFKNHLIAACPSDKNIDIKKSRYKKLSLFLAEMKAKGIINTSVTKGVESILSIKVRFFNGSLLEHNLLLI